MEISELEKIARNYASKYSDARAEEYLVAIARKIDKTIPPPISFESRKGNLRYVHETAEQYPKVDRVKVLQVIASLIGFNDSEYKYHRTGFWDLLDDVKDYISERKSPPNFNELKVMAEKRLVKINEYAKEPDYRKYEGVRSDKKSWKERNKAKRERMKKRKMKNQRRTNDDIFRDKTRKLSI